MKRIKRFMTDFKAFALKGNVVDMAVGVILGGAFSKIVSSLVNDIITPLISLFTGKQDLQSLSFVLKKLPDGTEVALKYGVFLQVVIDFLLIAFSIFMMVEIFAMANKKREQLMQKLVKKQIDEKKEEEKTAESEQTGLLKEILAAIKEQNAV